MYGQHIACPECPECPEYARNDVFLMSFLCIDTTYTRYYGYCFFTQRCPVARNVRNRSGGAAVRHATDGRRRPNAGPHLRRWQVCEARRMTARHTHEKCARFEAAPAASGAGHVGPLMVGIYDRLGS